MKKRKWKKLYETSATFVCPYCLKTFPIKEATVEHEPPKSRQRELGPGNTFYACKDCNREKGALTVTEYAEWKRLNFIRCGGLSR